MTAILGYARVSTTGQDLDAQLGALTAAGVESARIFTDMFSRSARPERQDSPRCSTTREPVTPLSWRAIDRLGRSVAEVTHTIADLGERRIMLRALGKV